MPGISKRLSSVRLRLCCFIPRRVRSKLVDSDLTPDLLSALVVQLEESVLQPIDHGCCPVECITEVRNLEHLDRLIEAAGSSVIVLALYSRVRALLLLLLMHPYVARQYATQLPLCAPALEPYTALQGLPGTCRLLLVVCSAEHYWVAPKHRALSRPPT